MILSKENCNGCLNLQALGGMGFEGRNGDQLLYALGLGVGSSSQIELDNDGLVGYANSIGISKNGFPIISYHHLNAGDLKLAYCENIDCSSAKIHLLDWAGDFGYFTDIAVANSGKVYISYLDRKNGDLRVIRCLDHKCGRAQINVLDKGTGKAGFVGEYNSIDITKQGYKNLY